VNTVYQSVAERFEIVSIKTRSIEDVHNLRNWHIDRMHPGPVGHFVLARNIAEQLKKRGWAISLPYQLSILEKSRAEKIRWLLRNGTPWFLKRSVDLLPAALILMLFELYNVIKEVVNPTGNDAALQVLNHIQSIDTNSQMLKAS
jgi:hypothetical protein